MVDWYTVAEKWSWQPDSIDSLDYEDLIAHADIAEAMFQECAKANAAKGNK